MKKVLLLAIVLIVGCEKETTAPIIEGCTTATACNYNAEAGKDDGSCLANDCAGVCGGRAYVYQFIESLDGLSPPLYIV